MRKNIQDKNAVIYQARSGAIELRGDFSHETIWASQAQIVELFVVDQSVVSRHIKNIFKDGEISPKSNMQKMHIANSDKPIAFYSLDVVLAVGYRTNSKIAAHLLYFVVKNHPFVDGNKRSGAYAFVWFLKKAKILDLTKMTPAALTALTLLVAESEAKNKERMIGLVLQLLKK